MPWDVEPDDAVARVFRPVLRTLAFVALTVAGLVFVFTIVKVGWWSVKAVNAAIRW